jgi:hypothetical protein
MEPVMPAPRTPRSPNWLPYLGLITMAGGIVWQAGVVTTRVDQLSDRVVRMEATQATSATALEAINLRGARNETKLDILIAAQTEGEKR